MTTEQAKACVEISQHFKIPLKNVRSIAEQYFKETGGDSPIMRIELPIGKTIALGFSKRTAKLGEIIFFNKFIKTDLYSDAVNLLTNADIEAVAFMSGKVLTLITESQEYRGVGGLFVKQAGTGYAIEPVKHYLQREYPIESYYHYD